MQSTSQGAIITSVSDDRGDDILFPRQYIATLNKERGGSHVCFPQFGPDGSGKLAQHGFGRDSLWSQIVATDIQQQYRLECDGEYQGTTAVLTYTRENNAMTMELSVHNDGQSAIRCSPGLHPYFATHNASVLLNGQDVERDCSVMREIFGDTHTLETSKHRITLSSDTLHTWAVWSDSTGRYLCVEPTLAGNAFLSHGDEGVDIIRPGGQKQYRVTITWEYKK